MGLYASTKPMSFTGLTSTALPTKAEQTFTGRVARQTATKATGAKTVAAMKGKPCKVAINGFGRIGRNFLRCWHGRANTMLDIVAINDSGGVKQASHLVKYDSVLGTFEADVKIIDDTHISIDGKFIETPGASKHLTAGAKKVVITAPAKGDDIPTYV